MKYNIRRRLFLNKFIFTVEYSLTYGKIVLLFFSDNQGEIWIWYSDEKEYLNAAEFVLMIDRKPGQLIKFIVRII